MADSNDIIEKHQKIQCMLKKIGVYLLVIIVAMCLGISFDFLFIPVCEITMSDITGSILYSPLWITFGSAHIPIEIDALRIASAIYGFIYWPTFIWVSIMYFRKTSKVYPCMLFALTFLAYFCLLHKFGALMSI